MGILELKSNINPNRKLIGWLNSKTDISEKKELSDLKDRTIGINSSERRRGKRLKKEKTEPQGTVGLLVYLLCH